MEADDLNSICSEHLTSFVSHKLNSLAGVLDLLFEASLYAADTGSPPDEFALPYNELDDYSIRDNDLRWLILRGWVKHFPSNDAAVTSKRYSSTSSFSLTAAGMQIVAQMESTGHGSSHIKQIGIDQAAALPIWDHQRHELTLGDLVVKRFRWPATNQETILTAFQEENWPARIFDPLPVKADLLPKKRLCDTIKCLNRNQKNKRIRFRGDGTGEGVLWELLAVEGTP